MQFNCSLQGCIKGFIRLVEQSNDTKQRYKATITKHFVYTLVIHIIKEDLVLRTGFISMNYQTILFLLFTTNANFDDDHF